MAGLNAAIPLLSNPDVAVATSPVITDVDLAEGLGLTIGLDVLVGKGAALVEGLGLAGTLVGSYGQVILERLRFALSQVTNRYSQITVSDATIFAEQLFPGFAQTVAETIGITLTQNVQQAVPIIEALNLQSILVPMAIYDRTISERINYLDRLSKFLGASLSETISIADTPVTTAALAGTVSEGLGLSGALIPQWVLRAVIDDSLDVDDSNILNMIYKPVLMEGLQLTALYLAPDGSLTTWAMNTRSAAVTEYTNYAFNSFARFGDICVGASDTGLYELLGDDDAGTDIIADIKSGFAQWAGSNFAMFKGIYLGVRGEGDFVLRLVTGDDKTYNYAVSTRNQRTTKVHLGKGLRARYWAFELISAGQDFDFDTIEFVPIVADRRV